jgi:hypothetical protein
MSQLKSLLQKARESKTRVADFAAKIADLRSRLSEAEHNPINYTEIDTGDEAVMMRIAALKIAAEILPKQIEAVDATKGAAMHQLIEAADALKRTISETLLLEQQKVVSEIVSVLEPYNATTRVNGQDINPGFCAAWSLPIITSMQLSGTLNATPPVSPRDNDPQTFDRRALEFADEAIGIAANYTANGDSFVPEFFRKKKR